MIRIKFKFDKVTFSLERHAALPPQKNIETAFVEKAIHIRSSTVHKAFNCDHEFLKKIIFSKYLFVYLHYSADTLGMEYIEQGSKKFNCKSYYFVQYILYRNNDPTSPLQFQQFFPLK